MKQTEDQIIQKLMVYLTKNGWKIDSYCLGQTRGNDIVASNGKHKLIVEAKGAKANDAAPTKKRKHFDSGQIKTHFGKAIVKILEEMHKNPQLKYAIAHPKDDDIARSIGHLIPFLKKMGIKHFWVAENGIITEE